MPTTRLRWLLPVALLAGGVPPAGAIDHANLDEGRPLRIEDPYPVAAREWALEAGAGFTLERRGADRGVFPFEVLYGAWPNLQLGLETLSTDPHDVDEPTRSGDLQLSALYNFNQETLSLPAFGLKLTTTFPTGVDSSGVDVEVKGLVTRSLGRLGLHLNAAYEFLGDDDGGDARDGRYTVVLGASYPVGAPRYTRTTALADLFTEQGSRRGEPNVLGVEVGFRHQLTPRFVLDAGVGTELAGPAERSRFFATAGFGVGF